MKRRVFSLLLALCLMLSLAPAALAAQVPTYNDVYQAMIAMKEDYPEKMEWTNDNRYDWNGYSPQNGVYWSGGYGCVGFAFLLSDAAFGKLPAREMREITIEDVRVGDILRINEDSHSVIVLEVHDDHVVIAEGNYEGTIQWGRKLKAADVAKADYLLTRYPKDYPNGVELTSWRKAYYDLIQKGVDLEGQEDFISWSSANYSLIDINGDAYPELWVDHLIYADGCHLATISENGLSCHQMQYSSVRYVEGKNLFLHSGGIQGYYYDKVCSIENGALTCHARGTIDDNENIYTWQGQATTKEAYNASIDAMVDPAKSLLASDSAMSYDEFIQLLFALEAEYGPESPIPTAPEMPNFTDVVPGAYYEEAVNWALVNGVTTGRTSTSFAPDDSCKRSEVVTFLWRSQNKPTPKNSNVSFSDVSSGEFYTDPIAWAVEKKVTNGMGDGTFGVNLSCTRGQVVTFLWRTAGSPSPNGSQCDFTDVVEGSYYYDAVVWAVENGITNGMGDGTFGVDRSCTRGQIVTFLHRFCK